MSWERDFRAATSGFEWPVVAELTDAYVKHLRASERVPVAQAKSILAILRESLRYDELFRIADAVLGQGVEDAAVRRQYAQALVDKESPAASLLLFKALVDDQVIPDGERVEAVGGIGRCYKQLFVLNTAGPRRSQYLQLALKAYRRAYDEDHARVWHGINVVALLAVAEREGIALSDHVDPGADAREVAREILDTVESDPDPDAWAIATACEASLALVRPAEALDWGVRFAEDRDADAFKIASFLRQLLEIWQLDTMSPPGDTLLPVLRSALLEYDGGNVVVTTGDVRASRLAQGLHPALEKVLGTTRFQSLAWYRTGLERCRTVARIENEYEDGIGTGFLVDGTTLHPALPAKIFITNGHVVPEALEPSEAVVVFRGLDRDGGRQRFRIVRDWWYEPSKSPRLDTALLELDDYPQDVTPAPLARSLPSLAATDPPRAYLIGHPLGLAQPQFSLQDNVLLDYDATLLHYRSPSEPGSSGSPVFNSQWELIGLHHAGGFDMPRLRSQGGSYAANEAILLPAIVAELQRRPPTPGGAGV